MNDGDGRMTLLPDVTECARCGRDIVRCRCTSCRFHGWQRRETGRHLCTRDHAEVAKALAPLAAIA